MNIDAILARYTSGLTDLKQDRIKDNTSKVVTRIYDETDQATMGIFLFGLSDKRIKANQSVGVVLNNDYRVTKDDVLYVCSQDNVKKNKIMSSVWRLNDKFQPNSSVHQIQYERYKNLNATHYFSCSWALAVKSRQSGELAGNKLHATLAKVSAYDLEKGILSLIGSHI